MRVIYIDVLFIINFYVTYLLLSASSLILHLSTGRLRRFAGAFLGGLCSALIFLPNLGTFLNLGLKLVLCITISFVSVKYVNIKQFIKYCVSFFIMNMFFSGAMLVFSMLSVPSLVTNNGYSYFDISVGKILLATAAAYFIIKIIQRFVDRKKVTDGEYLIRIRKDKSEVCLKGFADSGNTVCDFLNGLPVIICDRDKIASVIPSGVSSVLDKDSDADIKGIRIIPYATISDSGIIIAVRPDEIVIEHLNEKKSVNAFIGFPENSEKESKYEAVFNPGLLI